MSIRIDPLTGDVPRPDPEAPPRADDALEATRQALLDALLELVREHAAKKHLDACRYAEAAAALVQSEFARSLVFGSAPPR